MPAPSLYILQLLLTPLFPPISTHHNTTSRNGFCPPMGEKKNGNKKGGDGQNKEKGPLTFVFKVDCLCEGCASKILKCVRELEGVETVKTESNSNKVTVIGAVDPKAIKDNIAKKSKKKVDVISPQPKKDDSKEEKKPDKDKNQGSDNNKQEKKPKEAPLTTAELKVQLKCQCQGCIAKIRKIVSETKGVHELKVDKLKELVTFKGTMDVKALTEALKDKLKKNVEIVQPKKEKDVKKEGGENGAGNGAGGGGGGGGAAGGKKKNKGGNGGGDGGNDTNVATSGGGGGGGRVEDNRMEVMAQLEYGYGYMPGYPGYMPSYPGYGQPVYRYGYGHPHPHGHDHCYPSYMPNYPMFVHPPHQMFNDENPNACAIL